MIPSSHKLRHEDVCRKDQDTEHHVHNVHILITYVCVCVKKIRTRGVFI